MADLPKWGEVYKNLPDMPDSDYDQVRDGFFHSALWPAMVSQGKADNNQYEQTKQAFMVESKRPGKADHPQLHAATTSAAAAFLRPIASVVAQGTGKKEVLSKLNEQEEKAGRESMRQGKSPTIPQLAGNLIGAAPYFAAATPFVPAGAAAVLGTVGRTAAIGALGGAAYEGAAAPEGQRAEAASQGAVLGAVVPTAITGAAKGLGALAKSLQAKGAPPEVIRAAIAQEQKLLGGQVSQPGMVRQPPGFEYGTPPQPSAQWMGPRELPAPAERPRFYADQGGAPLDMQNPPTGFAPQGIQPPVIPHGRRLMPPNPSQGPVPQPGRVGFPAELERGPIRMGPATAEPPIAPPAAESAIIDMERAIDATTGRGQGDTGFAGNGEITPVYEPRLPVFPASTGKEKLVRVPGEKTVYRTTYALRELEDVHPSHNAFSFEPNPKYQLVNDRNYTDPRNHGRVIENAKIFDPEYLITDAPDATTGSPVITPEGDVLGGNSRTMILTRAYRGETPQAGDSYKRMLTTRARDFGLDPQDVVRMKEPVLVREIPESEWDVIAAGEDKIAAKQNAITDLNKSGTAPLTSAERAMADARRMSSETLDFIDSQVQAAGSDATLIKALEGKQGAMIINRLVDDGIVAPSERGSFINEKGVLTPFGKDRVSKMLLGRVFESSDHFDMTPPSVRQRLERIAEPLTRVSVRPEWDITPVVKESLTILDDARSKGIKNLGDLVAQDDMFAKPPYTPEAMSMALAIQKKGANELGQMFREYAAMEQQSRPGTASMTMFGPPPTRDEAFLAVFGDSRFKTGPRSQGTRVPLRDKPGTGLAEATGGAPIPGVPDSVAAVTEPVGPGKAKSTFSAANRDDQFHEGIHRFVLEQGIGPEAESVLGEVDPAMARSLRGALPDQGLYAKTANEETYVRLATAIRTGDEKVIQNFVDHDGTRDNVMEFAVKQTKALQSELYKRADSAQKRMAERKLQAVVRKAERSLSNQKAEASIGGADVKFENGKYYVKQKEAKGWNVIDDVDKYERLFEEKVPLPAAPEFIPPHEAPPGTGLPPMGGPDSARYSTYNDPPPVTNSKPGMPGERPLKSGWLGVSYWARPFLPWVQSVAKKTNRPDLYHAFSKLQDKVGEMENFRGTWNEKIKDAIGSYKMSRMEDFYSYLEAVEADSGNATAAAKNLNMTAKEIADMEKVRSIFESMKSEFGIDPATWVKNYLPRYRASDYNPDFVAPRRKLPKEIDFFAKHIRTGELDPRDRNLYSVMYNYIRLGAREKYLGEAYKEARELVEGVVTAQEGTGTFTSKPRMAYELGNLKPYFERHLDYVYGRPDHSYGIIQSAAQATLDGLNGGISAMNKKLPRWAQMDPLASDASEALNKVVMLQYAGALALRPMVHIRDATQLFMSYPMLGEKYFVTGLKKTFSKDAYKLAEKYGAIMHDSNMMNLMGGDAEIGRAGILTKAAKLSLKPQTWTSNKTRLSTFMGFNAKVGDAAKEFRATGDASKFMRESGIQWMDDEMAKSFTEMFSTAAPDAVEDLVGKTAAELTHLSQWDFKKGANAGAYKYAAGRLFGQYGTWPTNYMEYVRRLTTKGDATERMKATVRLSLVNGAILKAGEASGVDTAQWVFTQPLAYSGGPQFQAATSVLQAMDFDSDRGKEARSNLLKPGTMLLPGSNAMQNIWKAIRDDDPNLYMRILGFTPMDKEREGRFLHQASDTLSLSGN